MASRKNFEDTPTLVEPPRPNAFIGCDFVLTVVEGPDVGHRHRVAADTAQRTLIGQSPACDVLLTDTLVSRRHAALEPAGHRLRLTDLGSTNGTTVNGLAVVESFLFGGEVIRVGATAVQVVRERETGRTAPTRTSFGRVVGASEAMQRLYPLCQKLAETTITAIIEGETGTGKEVLAEALHQEGPRDAGPFVVFDCTAVPANLMESELFGYERGAFTGATTSRKGILEQAHGGTLLIDEIGDLEPSLQPKLLRAIERSEFRRLGGDKTIHADVRILCATRRDLDREVQAGRFRDDLFHRLAIARIELPPLRKRRGDVVLLARHIARGAGAQMDALPENLLARWDDYEWPGNVRELRNAVIRYLALGESVTRVASSEPSAPAGGDFIDQIIAKRLSLSAARDRVVEEFEARYLAALERAHGNDRARATEADVAVRHLQRLRARHGK